VAAATLEPGQVCGHCSMRAPPIKRCGMCRREVHDWPKDEIGYLEEHGWTLVASQWVEPLERVLRSPTPEMVAAAMNEVTQREMAMQSPAWGARGFQLSADKFRKEEMETGLAKARDRLARLRAGERFEARPQQRLSQGQAVHAEFVRSHPYETKTKDKVIPAYTKEQCAQWEKEARARHNGQLLESDADIIAERRNRTLTTHRQMCSECRQF